MTEKKFGWRRDYISAAPNTPSEDKANDNSKDLPAADRPATQPGKTPTEVPPERKS